MPTLLESLGAPPQSVVPTSVMEPTKPLPAPAPAIDEFAAFEDAAPADEFAAFEDAPPDEFSAFSDADDLDVRSVEELAADRDKFNPKEYYASHPELFSDPKKAAKFLDVYRIRDEEGLDAGQVAKAAVKEALPTVGKVAGGVRDVVEGAITVGLQPVANVFGGLITGDIFNKQRREELFAETRRDQKRGVAQFGAGSEASATGIADLGRQAVRKLPKPTGDMQDATFEESMSGKPRVKKTDQELLQQISADVEFGKQLGEIVQGRGEAAKAVGLDADTLAKEGITLDPEVIERLSLVDPLTIIAGAGIFKGVTAAGKTAFTAATREAAEAAIQRIAQVATRAATSPIRAVGKGIELTGTLSKKVAPLAPTVGAVGGGVTGGLSGAGAGYLAGVGARKGLRIGGALLESGGRGVAAAGEALGNSRILQQTLRGAAEGGIATAPLVAATDDDLAAGTLLGAGIGLGGGIRGGIAAAEAPALAIARSRLAPKNIVYTETKSPGYRRDKILDAAHEEAIQSVPETEKNEINAFRETARKLDSELYFLDDANFAVATQDNAARVLGRELTGQEKVDLGRTAEAEGFFDFTVPGQDGKPRRVIFLRQSADATTHEVGHLFFKTLAPERQAELVQSVRDSYTPEQIEQVRIDQSQRLGEDKSTDYAINEIAADSFSQVFRNTPVSELTAPPGLLQEIRRNVTDFAENLGLDLTAGERTDSVGISSSLRFNDVVRDAARELLSPKPRQPVVTPKAAPITLEQAARDLGPLVEPRVARQTPARPTPEVGATPDAGAAPEAVVDEARKIADEAPDTTLPGAAMSQKEILGTVAEIIAGKEGARYNYRNAPDVPGAAEEASRAPRRAEIEQARNLPEDLRRMTETTGIPYRIVKSSGGVVQVLDWAPDMLASNALRVAKALSDLAVKDPNNPVLQKIQYGLDVQKGEWTEQGWRDIFADAEIFSANQGKGFTGSGLSLEFPPEVVAAGRTAPAVTGTPVPLEQGIADFQNMLYNLRVPKTPRQGAKLPGNLVSQKISEATLPGRLRQPALVEPRKAGETGVRKPFKSGEEILDPNPLRAEFETALQGASIPLPDGIEVVRRLNLEHIADVVAEPNLPKTVGGVTPVLEAGFAAPEREWRISGQRRGAKAQVTVKAPDIASARKVAEAQGLRVATVEAADKMTNAMFSAPRNRLQKAIEEAKNIVSDLTTGGDDSALLRSLDRSNRSLSDAELPVPKGVDRASERLTELLDDATRAASDLFEGGQFQAATAKGRATEERGFEIRHSGGPANPSVTLFKDGLPVGDISAIRKSPTEADIALIDIDKDFRGQGLSEILYREIGNRLQAEGVENVTGMVVNQRALASRSKVFPDTAIDEIEVRGRTSFMVQSPITPRSQFQAPKALAERVEKFAPDEFRAWARDEANNNVTGAANEVGRNAPDQDFVDSLKQRYDASVRKSTELLDAIRKDPAAMMDRMNDLSAILLQGQFFREAWETARGTDSAGNRLRDTDPDYVPPFPPTEAKAQFAAPKRDGREESFFKTDGLVRPSKENLPTFDSFSEGDIALAPAWVLRDGKRAFGDSGFYHDDAVDGYNALRMGDRPAEQFQNDTGAMRIATFASEPHLRDYGGDLGVSISKEPSGAQVSYLRELFKEKLPNGGDPVFQSIAIDVLNSDGSVLAGRTFEMPREQGAAMRFFRDPITSSKGGKEVKPVVFDPELEAVLAPHERAYYETVMRRDPWKGWEQRNLANQIKDMTPADRKDFSDRLGKSSSAQFAAPEKKFKAREFPSILKKVSEGTQDGETFNQDGTAFRPAEGELLDVVTLASENIPAADLTPAKVAAAFPELSFLLAEPNVKLGVFRLASPDAEGRPQVSVDLNTVVDQAHRENTTAFARENNQESFFDLDKFETIATGGDGNTVLKDPTKIAAAVKSLVAGEPVQFAAQKEAERTKYVRSRNPVRSVLTRRDELIGPLTEAEAKFIRAKEVSAANARGEYSARAEVLDAPIEDLKTISIDDWRDSGQSLSTRKEFDAQFAPRKKKAKDKYALKPPGAGFSKAWILPTGEPVQLGGKWHHQWLSENPDVATKYNLDVPAFEGGDAEGVREGALKKGFVRVNHAQNSGTLTIEARAKDWRKVKSAVERLVESNLDNIDNMTVHLLDDAAVKTVDSQSAKLFEFDDAEKLQHLPFISEGEVRGQFAAKKKKSKEEVRKIAADEIVEMAATHPEALPLEFQLDKNGAIKIGPDNKPIGIERPYDLFNTPLALKAAEGHETKQAQRAAIVRAYADKLKLAREEAAKNPAIEAGKDWYSLTRAKLQKLFGDDTKLFAQILGATSANTPVDTNFRFAIDAYNKFKAGDYDAIIAKYAEGKAMWEAGDISAARALDTENTLGAEPTRGKFREFWIKTHNLKPRQSNGKKFGFNSNALLRVLDGSWRAELGGPKTGQFSDNLSGADFNATIDVWAARLMRRMGNEGNPGQWRILAKNEDSVSDKDFDLAQDAFRLAGEEMGISPDSLQAIVWFLEKDIWATKGWTKEVGAKKSDFNAFLDITTRGASPTDKLTINEIRTKPGQKKVKAQLDLPLESE